MHRAEYGRIRELPEEEREAFARALGGQTRPLVEGTEWKDQDYFYWEDYDRWKRYGDRPPVAVWD